MFFLKSISIFGWVLLSIISLNHLYSFYGDFVISMQILGLLAWLTIFSTLAYLCRWFVKQAVCIFLVFFFIGFLLGPYLEPPADTLDHLKRNYSYFSQGADSIPKKNRGFWHYSMSSNILYFPNISTNPETTLRRIDLLHGVYWAVAMVVLFVLSKSAGLPDRWATLSILIAFLFFGTNRFSYFAYYSLAPGFSSILIYWLWIASFFFKKNIKSILAGLLLAIISLPILRVNHFQESFFMMLIVSVWLFLNVNNKIIDKLSNSDQYVRQTTTGLITGKIWKGLIRSQKLVISIYVCIIISFFFILPQFEYFQKFCATWFDRNLWIKNQAVVHSWGGVHFMGKIWDYRVFDTLGIMGVVPVLLSFFYFRPGIMKDGMDKKSRIYILGILPFVGFCIPLYHFIWVSNSLVTIYYRLCYSSIFWLSITYFLYHMEVRFAAKSKYIS